MALPDENAGNLRRSRDTLYRGSERRLFLAVVSGEVRARLNGRVHETEWLKQTAKLKTDESNPFGLPADIELSVDDARRKWPA